MYIKDRSFYVNPSHSLTLRMSNNGGPFSSKASWNPIKCFRSVQGDNLPDFSRKISMRSDATTPLIGISDTIQLRPIFVDMAGTGFGQTRVLKGTCTEQFNLIPPTDGIFSSSSMDIARAKALSQLNQYVQSKQSPFSAQIFAGEIRETLQFIKHPLETSVELLRSAVSTASSIRKKGITLSSKDKNRHRLSKALADQWLELRFAILPLVNDIQEILKILEEDPQTFDRYRFYGEFASRTTSKSLARYDFVDITNVTYTDIKYQYIVRVGFITKLLQHVEGLQGYLKTSFSDLSQVVPTIWELTPYSFLIDYFVNIGDILNAPLKINSFASYVCASKVQTASLSYHYLGHAPQSGWTITKSDIKDANGPQAITTHRRVDRSSLTSTVPPLVFQLPGSNIRLANISALLTKLL